VSSPKIGSQFTVRAAGVWLAKRITIVYDSNTQLRFVGAFGREPDLALNVRESSQTFIGRARVRLFRARSIQINS